jgi:hypothetical protein
MAEDRQSMTMSKTMNATTSSILGSTAKERSQTMSPRLVNADGDQKNFFGVASPRSNQENKSLSSTGSWYYNRSFHETERLKEDHGRGRSITDDGAGIGEGERFLLRRCKAILMRRHGTLNTALKRLEVEFARGLSLEEFTMACESFFKPSEARYIFRCLDAKHKRNRVSVEQLLNRLEELCLDQGGPSNLLT